MRALMLVVVISASYLPDYKIIVPAYEIQISKRHYTQLLWLSMTNQTLCYL